MYRLKCVLGKMKKDDVTKKREAVPRIGDEGQGLPLWWRLEIKRARSGGSEIPMSPRRRDIFGQDTITVDISVS